MPFWWAWGASKGETFHLAQFFMRDPSEEAALLEGLMDFLAPCAALVTFNGKAFDAPLLVTRYSLHSIPVPFKEFAHLDLLPLARRLWRDRLPSRALKYLEENVLGAPRTIDEVPGYEIPNLYFDYLRTGDAAPLKGVFYHNAMDIVALAALMNHMASILHAPFDGQVSARTGFHCPGETVRRPGPPGGSSPSLRTRLAGWRERSWTLDRLCKGYPHYNAAAATLSLPLHYGKKPPLRDMSMPMSNLAKYYEHHLRDYPEALKWTKSAEGLVSSLDIPRYEYRHWMEELDHRKKRLKEKAQK